VVYCVKMLEPELCSSRVLSPFREESGDEELSVLPRHTKVIVTGNNRTKSVLVGLQGVVKKAVGLGGWHWLVFAIFLLFQFIFLITHRMNLLGLFFLYNLFIVSKVSLSVQESRGMVENFILVS
jgi:hypothetical protein